MKKTGIKKLKQNVCDLENKLHDYFEKDPHSKDSNMVAQVSRATDILNLLTPLILAYRGYVKELEKQAKKCRI